MTELNNREAFRFMQRTLYDHGNPQEGLRALCKWCAGRVPHPAWDRIAELDVQPDIKAASDWFREVLETTPPGDAVKAFWLGLPDLMEWDGRLFYLSGSDSWDGDYGDAEWACDMDYEPEADLFCSSVMQVVAERIWDRDDPEPDLTEHTEFVFPLGYGSLLVREAIGSVAPTLWNRPGPTEYPIAVGYDEGEWLWIGAVTNAAWIARLTPPA